MQETMWSNSFRRKEGLTHVSSSFTPSVHTYKYTHIHTRPRHMQSKPPSLVSSQPLSILSPAWLNVPDAFGPHRHNCTAACITCRFWGPMPLARSVTHICHGGIKANLSHLFPSALHDFRGNGVDLVVHFHCSLFPTTNFHQQDAEIRSSKIQGQEVTVLCCGQEHKEGQEELVLPPGSQ